MVNLDIDTETRGWLSAPSCISQPSWLGPNGVPVSQIDEWVVNYSIGIGASRVGKVESVLCSLGRVNKDAPSASRQGAWPWRGRVLKANRAPTTMLHFDVARSRHFHHRSYLIFNFPATSYAFSCRSQLSISRRSSEGFLCHHRKVRGPVCIWGARPDLGDGPGHVAGSVTSGSLA